MPSFQVHFNQVSLQLPQFPQPLTAAYLDQGQGRPILMLHGFLGKANCWEPLIHHLIGHNYRCIALDLMGFGQSAKPPLRYDIATEVAFVRAFAAALGLDSFDLLGHSLGGWVAAAYAIAQPQQVQALILAAPAGIRDDSFCGRYDHLRPILWPTPWVDVALTVAQPFAALLQRRSQLEMIRWFRRELMAEPAARSFLLDRLRPEDAIDTVEQVIHQIQPPTLVIAGALDATIPLWHCETYAREIPQAQFVVLPEADHALPQNYSTELATEILKFTALGN